MNSLKPLSLSGSMCGQLINDDIMVADMKSEPGNLASIAFVRAFIMELHRFVAFPPLKTSFSFLYVSELSTSVTLLASLKYVMCSLSKS